MTLRKLLLTLCVVVCPLATQANQVTFQVDMSYQILIDAFNPATQRLEVRGPFNAWNGGLNWTLTPSQGNPEIFTGTFEIPGAIGSTMAYKFFRTPPDTWEAFAGDRSFTLESTPQILPVVFFSNDRGAQPVTANVTFQVNMGTQIAAGNFNPGGGDYVIARGDFNNWGANFVLTPSAENTNIFVGTTAITQAPGSIVQYKFNMQRGLTGRTEVWEVDQPPPSRNREVVFTGEDQIIPAVYFNNLVGVPIQAAINFAVNMNAQIAGGKFDDATHEIYVRGSADGLGWGNPPEGLLLEADAARPGIYTNTFKMPNALTGDTVFFKFVIWNFVQAQPVWEHDPNKEISFTGTEPIVGGFRTVMYGPRFFDDIATADILTQPTLVTFRVNMNNAARIGGGAAFNSSTETVWMNGTFLANGWSLWNALTPDLQLWDDGATAGDTVAGDKIYTGQYMAPRGTLRRIEYKYGINALDNEALPGSNHVRWIRGNSEPYILPLDTFGGIATEPLFGGLTANLGAAGHVTLNWLGYSGVRLQKLNPLGTGTGQDIPNTDGKNTYDFTIGTNNPAFFRLVQPTQ